MASIISSLEPETDEQHSFAASKSKPFVFRLATLRSEDQQCAAARP